MVLSKSATPAEKRTVSVRLPAESARRLRVVAAKEGLSMGAYLARLWEESPASGGTSRKKADRT
jgi:predicted DNA binding CopG/RHH family protein